VGYTAGNIMDSAALWLNDVNKTKFTYVVLTPFLKEAYQELEDIFVLNSIQYSFKRGAPIAVAIGATTLTLPADFSLPISLQERASGATTQPFPMTEKEVIPVGLPPVEALNIFSWNGQIISFPAASTTREVFLDYWRTLPAIVDQATNIDISHVKTYLSGRTASMASFVIDENMERASALDGMAQVALGRALGIETKKKQNQPVRRRPFRAFHR
jgi:hypothetical protein